MVRRGDTLLGWPCSSEHFDFYLQQKLFNLGNASVAFSVEGLEHAWSGKQGGIILTSSYNKEDICCSRISCRYGGCYRVSSL